MILNVESGHDVYEDNYLNAYICRAAQPWISAATCAAGLLGTIVGWLIFGWARCRTVGHAAATILSGGAAILDLVRATFAFLAGMKHLDVYTGDDLAYSPVPFLVGFDPADEFAPLAIPAEVLFVLTSAVPAFCRRARVSEPIDMHVGGSDARGQFPGEQ